MRFNLVIVLFLLTGIVKGQDNNFVGDFNPYLQFKQVEPNKVRVRVLARDYFELREMARLGLKVEVTSIGSKNGDSFVGKNRLFVFDTAKAQDWSMAKSNQHIATIAQLKYGKAPMSDSSELGLLSDVYKYQNNIYALSLLACSYSWDAAKMSLSGFELSLSKDSMYIITVSLLRSSTVIRNQELDIFYSNKREHNPNSVGKLSLLANKQDRRIELKWMEESHYISYDILRSDKKNGPFVKRNSLPFSNGLSSDSLRATPMIMYLDSTEKNYKIYYYKLVGYDLFGEREECSLVFSSYSVDATPPTPFDTIGSVSKSERNVRLFWPPISNPEVDKIKVYYGYGTSGPWKVLKVLKPNSTSFTHDSADNIQENYYVVSLVDTAGNEGKHLPKKVITLDTIAPDLVKVATGSVDSLGKVLVRWVRSESNDVRGYRVAFSNRKEGPYSIENGMVSMDTVYRDSVNLRILKRGFYFKVQAIDYKNNSSVLSQAFWLEIPDIVPPSMARIREINALSSGFLSLQVEFSKQEDIVGCCIQRINVSTKDTTPWCFLPTSSNLKIQRIKKFGVVTPSFENGLKFGPLALDSTGKKSVISVVDSVSIPGQLYKYRVCLVDAAGNVSTESIPMGQKSIAPAISVAGVNWKIEAENNQFAKISWNNLPTSAYLVMVFRRSSSDTPFQYVSTVKSDVGFFIDRGVQRDFFYEYYLIIGDKFGSNSDKSMVKSFQLTQ